MKSRFSFSRTRDDTFELTLTFPAEHCRIVTRQNKLYFDGGEGTVIGPLEDQHLEQLFGSNHGEGEESKAPKSWNSGNRPETCQRSKGQS